MCLLRVHARQRCAEQAMGLALEFGSWIWSPSTVVLAAGGRGRLDVESGRVRALRNG